MHTKDTVRKEWNIQPSRGEWTSWLTCNDAASEWWEETRRMEETDGSSRSWRLCVASTRVLPFRRVRMHSRKMCMLTMGSSNRMKNNQNNNREMGNGDQRETYQQPKGYHQANRCRHLDSMLEQERTRALCPPERLIPFSPISVASRENKKGRSHKGGMAKKATENLQQEEQQGLLQGRMLE